MIKATGRNTTDDPVLMLGLSRNNTQALLDGRPIRITAAELVTMGLPGTMDVVIVAGETEGSIARTLGLTLPEPEPGERIEVPYEAADLTPAMRFTRDENAALLAVVAAGVVNLQHAHEVSGLPKDKLWTVLNSLRTLFAENGYAFERRKG